MSKIFISYRRVDSELLASMLHDKLEGQFGKDSVFLDSDSIPLGANFRRSINSAVGQCDVLLSLIGDLWISAAMPNGQRRIDSPRDCVRIEIESALKRRIPVIPVLTGNAKIPQAAELPASLQDLVNQNAAKIRAGREFKGDIQLLLRRVGDLLRKHPEDCWGNWRWPGGNGEETVIDLHADGSWTAKTLEGYGKFGQVKEFKGVWSIRNKKLRITNTHHWNVICWVEDRQLWFDECIERITKRTICFAEGTRFRRGSGPK